MMSTGRAAGDFVDKSVLSLDCLSFYNIALICVSQVLVHPAKGGPGFELLRRGGGQSEEKVEKGGNFFLLTFKTQNYQLVYKCR